MTGKKGGQGRLERVQEMGETVETVLGHVILLKKPEDNFFIPKFVGLGHTRDMELHIQLSSEFTNDCTCSTRVVPFSTTNYCWY
jgi:hypothetical protein